MELTEVELLALSKEIAGANRQLAGTCTESIQLAKEYRQKQLVLSKICLEIYQYWMCLPTLSEQEKRWCKEIIDVVAGKLELEEKVG